MKLNEVQNLRVMTRDTSLGSLSLSPTRCSLCSVPALTENVQLGGKVTVHAMALFPSGHARNVPINLSFRLSY
jgi:hypothetical protein